jgi:hypothetical protein
MLQWIKPTSEDYSYALYTFKASYWYRQAAIAQDDNKHNLASILHERGKYYDRQACKFKNTRDAWIVYDNAYKSWRENACSSAKALEIIRMLEACQNGL